MRNFICPDSEELCKKGECKINFCAESHQSKEKAKQIASEKLIEAYQDVMKEINTIAKMSRSTQETMIKMIEEMVNVCVKPK